MNAASHTSKARLRFSDGQWLPVAREQGKTITPDTRDLLAQVRAGFVARHTTLAEWCRAHGTHPSAARQAIYGTWAGPKGQELKAQLLTASGVVTKRTKAAA